MVLSNVFCVQKVVGLHDDVMSSLIYAYFTFFGPKRAPRPWNLQSPRHWPRQGAGVRKLFFCQKHLFSSQDLLKKVLEPFLRKKISKLFWKFFEKNRGGPRGPEKPKWSEKVVGLHNDVMSGPIFAYFTVFGPKRAPKPWNLQSPSHWPRQGAGVRKLFFWQKHFFSSQDLVKSVVELFLRKQFFWCNFSFFGRQPLAGAGAWDCAHFRVSGPVWGQKP